MRVLACDFYILLTAALSHFPEITFAAPDSDLGRGAHMIGIHAAFLGEFGFGHAIGPVGADLAIQPGDQLWSMMPRYQDHFSWNNTASCSSRKR